MSYGVFAFGSKKGMLDPSSVNAFTTAISGLNAEQAALALTTRGLTETQQKQVLLNAGLIASSDHISGSLIQQALANEGLDKEKQDDILINLGLMDSQTKELIATRAVTEELLRQQLINQGYQGEKLESMVASAMQTKQNGLEAISWEVLGAKIKKASLAMLKNPLTWVAAGIAAIAGLVKGYDALIGKHEKLAKQDLEKIGADLQEVEEEISSLEALQAKLIDAKGNKSELAKISEDLNSVIGETKGLLNGESKAWDVANTKIEANIALLKEQKKQLQQDKIDKSRVVYDNNAFERDWNFDIDGETMRDYVAKYNENLSKWNSLSPALKESYGTAEHYAFLTMQNYKGGEAHGIDEAEWAKYWGEQADYAYNVFADTIDSYEGVGGQGIVKQLISDMVWSGADLDEINDALFTFIDNSDIQDTINTYWESFTNPDINTEEALKNVRALFDSIIKEYPELKGFFNDYYNQIMVGGNSVADNTVKNVDKMTVSIGELEKASDKIKTLGSAFKELSDDGYITTKTLGEIQTATGLSGDEWEDYQAKLMRAKLGSSEFSQVMSELTYKILDNAFANKNLNELTKEQITAVLRENGVVNASAVAHDWLAIAKAKSALAAFDFAKAEQKDIDKLYESLKLLGLNETAIKKLSKAYAEAQSAMLKIADEGVKTRLKLNDAELAGIQSVAEAYSKLNNKGYDYDGDGIIDITTEEYQKGDYDPNSAAAKQYKADREALAALGAAREEINNIINSIDTTPIKIDYSGVTKDSDKNKPNNEDPTEAIIDRINLRHRELEQQEEYIKNALEIAELENDYKKQISLTNDLIDARKKRIDELNTANAGLHNEAEYLRNNNPWNEEEWFDSQGNATEAYYNLLNSASTKEEQEAIKDLFERLSKYKKAYMENAEEIVGLNKEILQDEEKIVGLGTTEYENRIRDIEHARDMALEANPFTDTTSYYKQMQQEYHKEAERLRALDPEKYKEEIQELQKKWWDAQNAIVDWRWENSQNWINQRNAYNDWALFGDSEIDAWERVVKWLKEEYPNDLDKIKEAEQSLFEARKKEFDKANEFSNTYLESRKTLLQSYYNVTNSIAEAQHEINKELETSKTMYEWLDKETQILLFNQDDYNTLSEELLDIQYAAQKLQRQYERDLNNSTLETIESITSQYQMQYETLMKSYEIAKADLEIAKKKQKLNNVLNERNVRMFINGSWQWVANTEDVINAKSELADAEYAKRVEESGLAQQQSINNLTRQQDELTIVIKKFENGVVDLTSATAMAKSAIESLANSSSSTDSNSSSGSTSQTSSGSTSQTKTGGKTSQASSDSPYNSNTNFENERKYLDNLSKNGTAGQKAWAENQKKELEKAEVKYKLADGTRNTPGGMTLMGEEGFEAYINSNGHLIPINQPTIGNIASGGIVFNTDQMKNLRTLWDMSNLNIGSSQNLLYNTQPQHIDQRQDNRIIINGMTVDSGSSDGQALISALRRYVGNH